MPIKTEASEVETRVGPVRHNNGNGAPTCRAIVSNLAFSGAVSADGGGAKVLNRVQQSSVGKTIYLVHVERDLPLGYGR